MLEDRLRKAVNRQKTLGNKNALVFPPPLVRTMRFIPLVGFSAFHEKGDEIRTKNTKTVLMTHNILGGKYEKGLALFFNDLGGF